MPSEQDSMWILSHPWFVGIVGGIVSGLIVFWVTRLLFSQREDRLYKQNISAANQEVLVSLRPVIAEGAKIDPPVVSAMIQATARKWAVRTSEMYSIRAFGQELIKEVMDSSFMNHQTKENHCKNIVESLMTEIPTPALRAEDADMKEYQERRENIIELVSAMVALSTALVTVLVTVRDRMPTIREMMQDSDNILLLLLPAIMAILMVAVFIYGSAESKRRRSAKPPTADKKEK